MVATVVSAAASAVELVGRFEAGSRYVDFAPTLALSIGDLPVALRVQLVKGRCGKVARIDLANAARDQ